MKVRNQKLLGESKLGPEGKIPPSPHHLLQPLHSNASAISETGTADRSETSIFNLTTDAVSTKVDMASDKKIFSFTDPIIHDNKKDLSSRWYVRYSIVYANGVKRPMKVYGQINRKHTVAERMRAARSLQKKVRDKLLNYEVTSSPELEREMMKCVHDITVNDCLKTRQCYESKVRMFCKWCTDAGIKRMVQLNAELMKIYFQDLQKKLNPNTINDYRLLLKAILKRSGKESLLAEIVKLRESPQSDLMFSPEQQKQIIDYLVEHDPLLLQFIHFMFYTLQRPGREMSLMKIIDINIHDATVRVDAERAKNRKEQWVTLPDQLKDIIQRSDILKVPGHFFVFGINGPSEKHVGRDYWSKRHKKVLVKLGFPEGYTCYSWNHTGAIMMFKALRDVIALMHQKRHSNLQMTYNYLRQHAVAGNDEVRTKYPTL